MPVFPTPLHILVVEDNLVNQKVLCRQLSKAKLTYDGASLALSLPLRLQVRADSAPGVLTESVRLPSHSRFQRSRGSRQNHRVHEGRRAEL